MLGLAEYIAARTDLRRYANWAEDQVTKLMPENPTSDQAAAIGLQVARQYRNVQRATLATAMQDVTRNALEHYQKRTGIVIHDELINDKIMQAQYDDRYYGATLTQRLRYNDQLLARRINKAADLDPKFVSDVWTKSVPHGSQYSTDRMLLLSTVAKIEQDVAREYAARTEHKLVRWSLSHRHRQTDICDDLANGVDRAVVAYLNEHNLQHSPKGLYFVDDLPVPPHPNCQCEYGIIRGSEYIKPGQVDRALDRVRRLLRKLWKK